MTVYFLVAACILLAVIPGYLTKPVDIDTFDEARRWAEPRDYYSQMGPQMPNDIGYAKNKHSVNQGSYEANFKVSSKKVFDPLESDIIMLLKWYDYEKKKNKPLRSRTDSTKHHYPILSYTNYDVNLDYQT